MAKLGDVIMRDTLDNRPAAGVEGRIFYATDTYMLYRDSGSEWEPLGSGVPTDWTGKSGKFLAVKADASGLEFL